MANTHLVPFTVAVAQVAPVFLDRTATLEKACEIIVDAGHAGSRLIVFPTAFIPCYPAWVWTVPQGEQHLLNDLYTQLLANAVTIPSETTDRLCRIAQRARINVVMGLNERDPDIGSSACYHTLLYIDSNGQIIGKHRSLVLAKPERLVWTPGDGSTLQAYKLPTGIISGLLGTENYLPLARYALYAWGTQLYIASAWEHGEIWLATLRHIAKEGSVFVLGCGIAMHMDDIPDRYQFKHFSTPGLGAWLHRGDSVIINPEGELIAGPLQDQESILYAEIDPRLMSGPRWMQNVTGYDARPDIFHLTIQREPNTIMQEKQ